MNPTAHDPNTTSPEDTKPVAFCQNCGRPLSKETVRVVGPAVYCEPCLAARLNGASAGPAYQPVNSFTSSTPPFAGTSRSAGRPNPNLAALLGLMPGVGAMYNEQYAKGIAHLFIFGVLVSLSHISDLFGVLLSGWIFYMAIEAHHTAKARRDGTPLPNPFGLNDIGERLGFDANLRRAPEATPPAPGAAQAPPYAPPYVPPVPSEEAAYHAPEPMATWGAPVDTPSHAANPAFVPDSASRAYPPNTQSWPPQPPPPSSYPFAAPPYGPHIDAPPLPPAPTSRFPAGAIGLMVLGTIFLLGTTGVFHNVSGHVLVGFGLIGLGAWVFTRRFTSSPAFQHPGDASNYRLRILRALTPSAWLVLLGTLFLLDALRLLRWSYSWPWIIIFAGFLLLLKRTVPASAYVAPMPPVPPVATDFSQQPGPGFREGR